MVNLKQYDYEYDYLTNLIKLVHIITFSIY